MLINALKYVVMDLIWEETNVMTIILEILMGVIHIAILNKPGIVQVGLNLQRIYVD